MRHIVLDSLQLGLADLLSKRRPPLQSFANGAANVPLITIQYTKICALPKVLLGRPLVDELDTVDTRHDGLGRGIYFITEAYLRLADATPELISAAKKIRTELIPALDALTDTYESEAQRAKVNKEQLDGLKPALELFPVVDGTLYDWAVKFVAAGEQIDTLLSERADAKDRAEAAALRSDTVGLLNRLRKSLQAEQKANPSLPADLEAQVFGYFDLLENKAAEAHAEAKRKAQTPNTNQP